MPTFKLSVWGSQSERNHFDQIRKIQSVNFIHYVFFRLYRDSSVDDENSGESPLISIWGEYTGLYSLCMDQWILGYITLSLGL